MNSDGSPVPSYSFPQLHITPIVATLFLSLIVALNTDFPSCMQVFLVFLLDVLLCFCWFPIPSRISNGLIACFCGSSRRHLKVWSLWLPFSMNPDICFQGFIDVAYPASSYLVCHCVLCCVEEEGKRSLVILFDGTPWSGFETEIYFV